MYILNQGSEIQTPGYFHNVIPSSISRKMYIFVQEKYNNFGILAFLIIFELFRSPLFYDNGAADHLREHFHLVIKVDFLTASNG